MSENKIERPVVGVGVCIIRNAGVLLGKRKSSHGEGCWSFPGGHLEINESWEQCAEREAFEETGIKIKNLRFAAVTNDIFADEGRHYITIFILADHDSGEVILKEPDKCSGWKWFGWDNLPEPLFLPVRNLIRQGFRP